MALWKSLECVAPLLHCCIHHVDAKPAVPAFVVPFVENRDEWGGLSSGGAYIGQPPRSLPLNEHIHPLVALKNDVQQAVVVKIS